MPLSNYGVLKGRVSTVETEPDDMRSPHVHVRVNAAGRTWVASLNVKSRAGLTEQDKWLLFHVSANFRHPLLEGLSTLAPGFLRLPSPSLAGLDYVRQNLVRREHMRPLPPEATPHHDGTDDADDLNEAITFYLTQARRRDADCYVFGEAVTDWRTGDLGGMHDVHFNQGADEAGPYADTNGTFQDGGLLVHHRHARRWVALFLAFQNQAWHTDDSTGHPLPVPTSRSADGAVRIVGARLPSGTQSATVTLLNASAEPVVLNGWKLRNDRNERDEFAGILPPGEARTFRLRPYHTYALRGGCLSLLDAQGWKVDGVCYTRESVGAGGVVVF